jgi:arylformamidase
MFTLLSFPFSEQTPAAGGRRALRIQVDEEVARGHYGNTFYITAWNHSGTHVDAPAHMLPGRPTVGDLVMDDLVFTHPVVVEAPKGDDELVMSSDLRPFAADLESCDLLLLRTGFGRYRATEPVRYQDHNPGLSVDAAEYLASPRFPRLHAVGIDSISMAAAAHVVEGVAAHKALFNKAQPHPLLLIEDMDLHADLAGVKRILVVPLFITGLDSSFCTVLAEREEEPGEATRYGEEDHAQAYD